MPDGKAWTPRRWLSVALITSGVCCLLLAVVGSLQAARFQHEGRLVLAAQATANDGTAAETIAPAARLAAGDRVGLLAIPRLAFSAVVAEGDDAATLRVAIGHLPDTPLPWAAGNSAIAGHRDTYFRALRHVLVGDDITLATPRGTFRYVVEDRTIVSPDDVSVLRPAEGRELTLITCYPFSYVGAAPQRFIVRARQRVAVRHSDSDPYAR